MSDVEEPPTKVSKYEMSQTYTQPEDMEDDQEEWLSEGLLTDDDCNPATEQDHSDSGAGNNSQTSNSQDNQDSTQVTSSKIDDSIIEQELNSMDNEQQDSLPDDLGAFLIRKTDGKVIRPTEEESDGNDTDDLLRMLEDDDKTKKKKVKVSTKKKQDESEPSSGDDEDDFIYEGATVKKLRVAKTVLMRKLPASKAVPEESSDETDASSDEGVTVKKSFEVRKSNNFAAKSTAKPHSPAPKKGSPITKPPAKKGVRFAPAQIKRQTGTIGNNIVNKPPETRSATSTPLRQYTNKSLLKPSTRSKRVAQPPAKLVESPVKPVVQQVGKQTSRNVKKVVVQPENKPQKPQPLKVQKESKPFMNLESDEIINEEEFLEDDDFDLDEDFAEESDSELDRRAIKQRIMKPEQLDEEMYSDPESQLDDDSLYDELPSSDSDDLADWFTLDIRGERAGDYLPLLGAKAYELLLEEKKRVSSRLDSLRHSLSSLAESGRQQENKIRTAKAALAEIDDMIKAS